MAYMCDSWHYWAVGQQVVPESFRPNVLPKILNKRSQPEKQCTPTVEATLAAMVPTGQLAVFGHFLCTSTPSKIHTREADIGPRIVKKVVVGSVGGSFFEV